MDLRYAIRMLRASPGFTLVALLSLSLGICIATCAYSEMSGFLRDLPGVPDPDALVGLHSPVSYPTYRRYRDLRDLFSSSFAYVAPVPFGISLSGRTERTWGQLVTSSYFSTLGVRPKLGRFLDDADEKPGRAPVVVISYQFWRDRLGSDVAVLGTNIRINGYPCTLIGVGPERFRGASPTLFPADLWLPVTVDARLAPELAGNALERRDLTMFQVVARLLPGVTEARAEQELTSVARAVAASYGELDRKEQAKRVDLLQAGRVLPVRKQDLPFLREFFILLGGLVLLIACANVANMMLARATGRRREISLRLALGASRMRLIRLLLTESLLLAALAAVPAFVLSIWLMRLASRMQMPLPIPIALDLAPDAGALLFSVILTAIAALAFGLAPAWQATHTDLGSALQGGGHVPIGWHRSISLRNALIVSQIAASLMLLLMTGYMGLGIQSTLGVQEGFDPRNLYLISLDPVRDGYSPERATAFLNNLLERVTKVPGVLSACLTDTLPVSTDGNSGVRFSSSGVGHYWAKKHMVGRNYFETAGVRILAGRSFRREDEESRMVPVIVTQEAVRQIWNDRDPVGQRIQISNEEASGGFGVWPGTIDYRANMLANETRTFEVIGVAHDVSEDLIASKKHPAVYFPLRLSDYAQPSLRGVTLMVRGAPGADVIGAVRGEVSSMDANVTAFNARSMVEQIDQFMSALKGASWTYGLIGLFGLVLASVGVAGVTAYSVAKRVHEIGIRMALGAQKRDVLALVMKEGAAVVSFGTIAGLALAWVGIRGVSSMFFSVASVRGADPVLLVGGPLLLATLALLACYVPARRSMQVDPVVALRQD